MKINCQQGSPHGLGVACYTKGSTENCFCHEKVKECPIDKNVKKLPLKGKIVLVDIDNTTNDWDRQFYSIMDHKHEEVFPRLNDKERVHYEMQDNYPSEYHKNFEGLAHIEKLWENMPVMPGAVEALNKMRELGAHVFFVTKIDPECQARSAYEKINWAERNFGPHWKNYCIAVTDKTIIKGDYLIDDYAYMPGGTHGITKHTWQHIIFCRPYNLHVDAPRLHSWLRWTELFDVNEK